MNTKVCSSIAHSVQLSSSIQVLNTCWCAYCILIKVSVAHLFHAVMKSAVVLQNVSKNESDEREEALEAL